MSALEWSEVMIVKDSVQYFGRNASVGRDLFIPGRPLVGVRQMPLCDCSVSMLCVICQLPAWPVGWGGGVNAPAPDDVNWCTHSTHPQHMPLHNVTTYCAVQSIEVSLQHNTCRCPGRLYCFP